MRTADGWRPDSSPRGSLTFGRRTLARLGLAAIAVALLLCLAGPAAAQVGDRVVPKPDVTTRVVLRASATASSADLGTLRPGDSAELLGSVPNWYEVRLASGVEGFVAKRWTTVVSSGPTVLGSTTPSSYTIDVVDVGTGLGILVRGPDFTLVYDAGSNDDDAQGPRNRMLAFVHAVAPTLTTLDHVILSHPHTDHVVLMADLLKAYQVRHLWDSGRINDVCGYRALIQAVTEEPGLAYHTAVQDGGTRDYAFSAADCLGVQLPAATLHVPLADRIDNGPIPLGVGASMTILHADGAKHASFNENSLVVRLDLGPTRVLLMGDAEAGGRQSPTQPPTTSSIEGVLLACCAQAVAADVLIAGHHGSRTSSRDAFLNAVMASVYVVSSGPTKYQTVVLPDADVIGELRQRGQLFRTDLNDAACAQNPAKIGPDADGKAGGCDNVRLLLGGGAGVRVDYWRAAD
jgi:beta-lactamase superfamily II metal-dependent hydrolase